MKKIFICLFLIVISVANCFALKAGDEVYTEVIDNGQKVNKRLRVEQISDYNKDGNVILETSSMSTKIYEYDASGKKIYDKFEMPNIITIEYWYKYNKNGNANYIIFAVNGEKSEIRVDYDEYGNPTRSASNKGTFLYEYKYDTKGNKVYEKQITNDAMVKQLEYWYRYDGKGNLIYKNEFGSIEYWYEYNNKGNLIHTKQKDGYDAYYDYEYWENGKVKRQIEYK